MITHYFKFQGGDWIEVIGHPPPPPLKEGYEITVIVMVIIIIEMITKRKGNNAI